MVKVDLISILHFFLTAEHRVDQLDNGGHRGVLRLALLFHLRHDARIYCVDQGSRHAVGTLNEDLGWRLRVLFFNIEREAEHLALELELHGESESASRFLVFRLFLSRIVKIERCLLELHDVGQLHEVLDFFSFLLSGCHLMLFGFACGLAILICLLVAPFVFLLIALTTTKDLLFTEAT